MSFYYFTVFSGPLTINKAGLVYDVHLSLSVSNIFSNNSKRDCIGEITITAAVITRNYLK